MQGGPMIGRIFTVGGFTLLSRITGFARDIVLAAVLGAGPIADAFFVALRLPNHFRAIFAEGAFNAAFVPAYAPIRQQSGAPPAQGFADRVFTLLLTTQLALLALACLWTPRGRAWCRYGAGRGSIKRSCSSSTALRPPPWVRPRPRSRSLPILSSQVFWPPARCPHSITPIASTSFRWV